MSRSWPPVRNYCTRRRVYMDYAGSSARRNVRRADGSVAIARDIGKGVVLAIGRGVR